MILKVHNGRLPFKAMKSCVRQGPTLWQNMLFTYASTGSGNSKIITWYIRPSNMRHSNGL